MERIAFRVTGISPLMQSSTASMAKPKELATASRKVIPTPDEEARSRVYLDENGEIYHPAEAFRSAIIEAASGFKIGKNAAGKILKSGIFNSHDRCPIFDPDTEEALKVWEIDTRRAVVQRQGIMRSRPIMRRWACEVELEYDEESLTPKTVLDFFEKAGKYVGVGEYRPRPPKWSGGQGGPFGRFTVELLAA